MLKNLFSFNYEIFDYDTNLEFSYKTFVILLGIILSNKLVPSEFTKNAGKGISL